MKKSIPFLIILINYLFPASPDPIFADNGMVVSNNIHASEAGINILKKGGNAVDAAVAVGFTLAVTCPENGNLGGGGFIIGATANGKIFTQDHREKAPSKSNHNMFLDKNGSVIPYMSLASRAASGVPGTVHGLLTAWSDHGSGNIRIQQLLSSAIKLAEKGFPLSKYQADLFNIYKESFLSNNATSKIFIRKDNRPWKKGDRFFQKDLAKTLKRIAKFGLDGFYKGVTAELIIKEMNKSNGLISKYDLEQYRSVYREPVIGSFRDIEIISMGPPSSGGLLLIHMLNALENFNIDTLGWNSTDYVHLLTEIAKRAYADRAQHLGDPDYWDNPRNMFLSKDYAKKRISNISMDSYTPSKEVYSGIYNDNEGTETTHYSVVDKQGNAVAITTTLNTNFGNKHVVEGAGFLLNNEMDDFSSKPGTANAWGLIGGKANAIEPNKRPLSSMTPTILMYNGQPIMTIGSPGGSKIITTVLQSILNVLVHDMDIKEAVCAPRFHHQWIPDNTIYIESNGLSKDIITNLESRGHIIKTYGGGYMGVANGIIISDDGLYGGGDCRNETSAIGY
ncbi:MAG: gamma-glutamyltransferase [bacterium TMED217]|nr:MAG: gamma-glutamyltransferase [bacterium TMED217]|tara:strand:- start:6691 stop:8382 length:1692 start_codon:yes stop_codon:yes gene_type:complete